MKTIKLIFQCYLRQGFDSFNLFLEPIVSSFPSIAEKSLKYYISPVTTLYTPVHPDDVPHEKKLGRMVTYSDSNEPQIVVYQLILNILSVPKDHTEILKQLLDMYSNDIVKYEITEEAYLNAPK